MRQALPVSIVIPVRNEAANLGEMFSDLLSLSPSPSEIVFVETGSVDGSQQRIDSWLAVAEREGISCRLVNAPDAFPGAARNAGVRAATQPWIAFLDAGISPKPDWLGRLWDAQLEGESLAIYGGCRFLTEHPFGRMIAALSYGQDNVAPVLPASLFHRQVFEKAGYFQEDLRSGEDILWNRSIASAGIPTATCVAAEVEYRHFPETPWRALKKWFVYEQSAAVAGLSSFRKNAVLALVACVYGLLALSVPGAGFVLMAYLGLRGGLDPIRRSGNWRWWNRWWQPIVIFPIAGMLDMATMAGRLTAWMGFSKFHLHVSDTSPAFPWGGGRHLLLWLWLAYFAFSTLVGLLFQKVLLPLMPGLHAGNGLLIGDSQFFHAAALHLAEEISSQGWGRWSLFPVANAYGNVGVLGAVYALFSPDPSLIVPVNACFHALSGVLIYLIMLAISGNERKSHVAALIGSALFVGFPSPLNWYGQLHKDGYAIAGTLLALWVWLKVMLHQPGRREQIHLLAYLGLGFLMIGMARPYALKLVLVASLGAWLIYFARHWLTKSLQGKAEQAAFLLLSLAMNAAAILYFSFLIKSWAAVTLGGGALQGSGENYADWVSANGWEWQPAAWLPVAIDRYFELLARTRVALIDFGITEGARSMVDIDQVPNDVIGILLYLPRAVQVALFAPFPTDWWKGFGAAQLVATGEMTIAYLGMMGLPFLYWARNRLAVVLILCFCLSFFAIYGVTTANLGTLYRLRYPFLMLMVGLGISGWGILFERFQRWRGATRQRSRSERPDSGLVDIKEVAQERRGVIGKSVWVFFLTFAVFVGFFLRDLLLATRFGLSAEVDAFYLALLLPMLAVSIFSIPLGQAITPIYLAALKRGGERLAAAVASDATRRITLWMIVLGGGLLVLTPSVVPYFKEGSVAVPFDLWGQPLYLLVLPILVLSGSVIVGNSVLNAHGYHKTSSGAQLMVPACSIAVMLLSGEHGVLGAMLGMVLGQGLNLFVIKLNLSQFGNSGDHPISNQAMPEWRHELTAQYLPLVISALFTGLVVPVSTLLATRLPEGSITALNLGTKVVLFMTGLLGAVLSTVILPYFSALVTRQDLRSARRELSYYMLLSVSISIPVTIAIFIWAKKFASIIFPSVALRPEELSLVAVVMQYSVLQLPFYASNALLLRFAIATRHVRAIAISALLGVGANVALCILLMGGMGVAGISFASSLAMLVATIALFLMLVGSRHIERDNAIALLLCWLVFLALVLCLHYANPLGVAGCLLGYVILLKGGMRVLRSTVGATNPSK